MAFDCPDCGEVLRVQAKSCACGWRADKKARSIAADRNQCRCEWQSSGERCRNIATFSPSTHGSGPWYCLPHSRCDDPIIGGQMVRESMERMPIGYDYTAENLNKVALQNYLARTPLKAPSAKPGNVGELAKRVLPQPVTEV